MNMQQIILSLGFTLRVLCGVANFEQRILMLPINPTN